MTKQPEKERRASVLTDDDVRNIAEELEHRLVGRFFLNLGKGFWAMTWKGIMLGLLGIAIYGMSK